MQFAKDSFYLALRDRLATLNPERKVVIDGVERPAVIVLENEPQSTAAPLPDAYYLSWGAPQIVAGSQNAARPLMKIDCRVTYHAGSTAAGGVDRGRALAALDTELLRLLTPPRTPKLDATRTPAVPLNSYVFWGTPAFETIDDGRAAALVIFCFPETEAV